MSESKENSSNRTSKGNVTSSARKKYGTVGEKFPVFSKRSAEAAVKLRGHASPAERKKILAKAARYAPDSVKKAREADKEKHSDPINQSQQLTDSNFTPTQEHMATWIEETDELCSGCYPSSEEAARVESFAQEVLGGYESTETLADKSGKKAKKQKCSESEVVQNFDGPPPAGTVLYTEIVEY